MAILTPMPPHNHPPPPDGEGGRWVHGDRKILGGVHGETDLSGCGEVSC